ncbi:hypothetical protein GEOBC_02615 [Geobacteraceae bacterium]|nr:hypothetical protein GEOBC_02615 [Geobacteraceae bacterium]
MEQRFVRSLLKPSVYPDPTVSVELVQTHVSYIFLTDRFAYKIKKPVNFGFLNFSTLDRRRFYCNEEVRLNRRLCPDIYLDVVEVRETPGGAGFSGDGRIIDYAVKMKRLPAERMLDRLLKLGKVSVDEIRAIARVIGKFHRRAERSDEIDRYGEIETIRTNWEENFQQTCQFAGDTLSGRDLRFIEGWVDRFIRDNAETFARRVAGGFIRDCDGDIHMENICLNDDGGICIFDCIEFNTRFRYGDTAADIAFLLMDFDMNRRGDFCGPFIEEYVQATGDDGITEVLDFYKVYRAYIRGKVESMRLLDPQIPLADKEAARERARRYFRLARGYIARRTLPPSLILTCGLTGTGKSFVARELAFDLGLEIVSSDVVRKELAGLLPTEHRRDRYGEGIYAITVTARTYDTLLERAETALAAGQSIIVDATFRSRTDRDIFRQMAVRHAARFHLIHANCPEGTAQQRLEIRKNQTNEPSDGRWEIYLRQKEEFHFPTDDEAGLIRIDTSKPVAELLDTLLGTMEILP